MSVLQGEESFHEGADLNRAGSQWCLLREDVDIGGTFYRAGTPVLKTEAGWLIQGSGRPVAALLDAQLCHCEYAGLSLHLVYRDAEGCLTHRRLGSDDPPEQIATSRVLSPPITSNRAKLYLAFGDQFYPLDFFGW